MLPPEVQTAANDVTRCAGKYVLVEEIPGGATRAVWKAYDRELARWVVLKYPLAQSADELERLRREGQLAARLVHPNIARIYDVSVERGNAYIAMEFVRGATLERAALRVPEALAAVRDAALAIEHAHREGVLHRDVKPGNLMREDTGRLVVLDFGLAKPVTGAAELTATAAVLGTPAYMAPEQAQGRVSVRSDVYSLGATLFHLVTGRLPFDGPDVLDVLVRVARGGFERPRALNPKLHPDIEAIVLKAMEHDPSRRYETAGALAEDLRRFLAGEPVHAKPPGAAARVRRAIARHRALSALAALVVVTALGGVVASGAIAVRKNREIAERDRRELDRLRGELARREAAAQAQPVLDEARRALEEAERLPFSQRFRLDVFHASLERARDLARGAIASRPDFAEAHYVLGRALELLQQDAEADAAYARAASLAGTYLEPRLARGNLQLRAYLDERRPPVVYGPMRLGVGVAPPETAALGATRAVFAGEFEAVARHSSRKEHAVYARGALAMADQDYAQARVHLEEYVALRPVDPDALFLLGTCALFLGDLREARERFEQSLEIRPWFVPGLMSLSIVYSASGEPLKSIQLNDRYLAQSPGNKFALSNRGVARGMVALTTGSKEHWEGCLADLAEAVRLDPDRAEWRAHLAMGNLLAGRLAEAGREADALVEREGPTAQSCFLRARIRCRAGEWRGAAEDLDVVLAAMPRHEEALAMRGVSRAQLGRWREALDDLTLAVKLAPSMEPNLRAVLEECRRRTQ